MKKLLRAVQAGERITICRRGLPVADLVPSAAPAAKKPRFGTMRGRVVIHDPDWWKAMTGEETDAFLEGRG